LARRVDAAMPRPLANFNFHGRFEGGLLARE
jgi:hypothetical protein